MDIIETDVSPLLHLEGLHSFIRRNPSIQNINVDEILNSSQRQINQMNSILDLLNRKNLNDHEALYLFKMMLGVNEYDEEESPAQFLELLSNSEYLTKIITYIGEPYDAQTNQMCLCVLTKIYDNCCKKVNYLKRLLDNLHFRKNVREILETTNDSTIHSERYNMILVVLNLIRKLYMTEPKNMDCCAKLFEYFYALTLHCTSKIFHDEDACDYALQLLHAFLCDNKREAQKFLCLVKDIFITHAHIEPIVATSCLILSMICLEINSEFEFAMASEDHVIVDGVELKEEKLNSLVVTSRDILNFLNDRLEAYKEQRNDGSNNYCLEHFLILFKDIPLMRVFKENWCGFDIIDSIMWHMENLSESATVQVVFLECSTAITNLEDSADSRWLEKIFTAMIKHPGDSKVQEMACRTLSTHIKSNPSICNLIGEVKNLLPVHISVFTALNIHSKDPSVFNASCAAIHGMAISEKKLQQYLVARQAHVPIIKGMEDYVNNPEIQCSGFHALRALAYQNPYEEELIFKSDIVTIIWRNLNVFKNTNEEVLIECIALLACLATDLEIVRRQCAATNVPDLTIQIAVEHVNLQDLVAVAMEAVAVLSTCEEQLLFRKEYLRDLRYLMSQNGSNAWIQQVGCIIMQLMSPYEDFVSNESVCFEIIQIVKDAMCRFEDNTWVQTEGCVAMYLLFLHKEEISGHIKRIGVEQCVHDTFFSIIEYFSADDEITLLAQKCLIELVTEQTLKDEVLLGACSRESITCAELLLRVGANVDAGGSTANSPIHIATSTGNLKLVELLLSYDVGEAASALSLCLEDPSKGEIAGVLLKHIGYEDKNGVITWSAMNIKEFKPEFLYPTLLSKYDHCSMDLGSDQYLSVPRRSRGNRRSYRRSHSFTEEDATPKKSRESPVHSLQKTRSTSQVDILVCPVGRNSKTATGAILPYHTLDPRLKRRNSSDKHVILNSPKVEAHYPNYPESILTSEIGIGKLYQFDRNLTPDMIEIPAAALKKSFSEINLLKIEQARLKSFSVVDDGPPQKMQRQTSPQQRTKSCVTGLNDELTGGIHMLDISHNKLSQLDNLIECPSNLITKFFDGLERLDISNNNLIDLPRSMSRTLPLLKYLNVSRNRLSCFPYDLFRSKQIEVVDLSYNRISTIQSDLVDYCLSITSLYLNGNGISVFPEWIACKFPRLFKLNISHNQISEIPITAAGLRALTELNMSHNSLKKLSGTFLFHCVSLETIDLSYNDLQMLPNYTPNTISRLATVKLSHNELREKKPFYVPQLVLKIPSLKIVDLSYNGITQLPEPHFWCSRSLKELRFAHNRIHKINITANVASIWPELSRLDLSNNKLKELPPEIGHLASLGSLNISHNEIDTLPDEIGRLVNLFDFPLDGLKLRHDSASLGSPRDMVSFFNSKLKNSVPYRRIKLMLVGLAGRGKTTLIRQLAQKRRSLFNVATVGIEVNDWILRPPKNRSTKKLPCFTMNTWDFAGQEDFYSTHQYFLSSRALYLAVYDASRGMEEIRTLTPWLLNIQAAAPGSLVVLVGTHADKIPKANKKVYIETKIENIKSSLIGPGFPTIRATAIVNCTQQNSGMESLREEIYDIISNFSYKGQRIVDQLVPKSYIELENLIRTTARKLKCEKTIPVCHRKTLWHLCCEHGVHLNYDECKRALKFLKETGTLSHFSDSFHNLSDVYFIDPQWLCNMMARIVTVKEINPYITNQGILAKADAAKVFSDQDFPVEFMDRYLRLLRKFEVVLPLTEEKYIVTCKLPENPPQFISSLHRQYFSGSITRCYVLPYVPNGFWPRLITRILSAIETTSVIEDELRRRDKPCQTEYWQNGIYIYWSPRKSLLVMLNPNKINTFDIFVPVNKTGYRLLSIIVNFIDSLIEEWYPGLSDMIVEGSNCSVQRLCPCFKCPDVKRPHYFDLSECISASHLSEVIDCPNCGPVLIESLAPDSVFADLNYDLIYKECQFDEQSELGVGGFASVFKANIEGTNLAIKLYRGDDASQNQLLRQEVDILRRLHHPCLISIIGVCLRPRLLLLEYAPLGDLENTLNCGRTLSRGMQHRIAVQICEGLAYLHRNKIVYRDLKPSNVLIFSLSMGMLINVKLSDYGISQETTLLGLRASKGTPLFQAPEVGHEHSEYHCEVDVFSFGITLYQIVTGGKMPFGDVPFQYELETAVYSNKPITSITSYGYAPWPDVEHLITQCLAADREKRPTAEDLREKLLSVDLLCLKREVNVAKNQSVECIAIRKVFEKNQENLEVWVGSGGSGCMSQLSWFSLQSDKKQVIQGMAVNYGRIFCMLSYKKYIIAGTVDNFIVVFDCDLKKERFCLHRLSDTVVCLQLVASRNLIIAGIANGSVAFYDATELKADCLPLRIFKPCPNVDKKQAAVACMTINGNNLICGVGSCVAEIHLDTYEVVRRKQFSEDNKEKISCIIVSGNRLYTACKDASVVTVWDIESNKSTDRIDCNRLLSSREKKEISERDSRVVSMTVVERKVLWVGCGSGHILLIDLVKHGHPLLSSLLRHTSAVRSVIATPNIDGKSSAVVTGGMGFRQWRNPTNDLKDLASVLVWEADLASQQKHLEVERKRRDELALQMSSEALTELY